MRAPIIECRTPNQHLPSSQRSQSRSRDSWAEKGELVTTRHLEVPRNLRRGHKQSDTEASLASAVELLGLLARHLGVEHLGDVELLDMGCGTKLVEAILRHQLPIGRYVGIDVYREMIEFLQREVQDPRFTFYPMNSHHPNYNPDGSPLSASQGLPLAPASFDAICLFSVFTHLDPRDYREMLMLLRPYIKPEGRLIYSLFVNERTPEGLGLADDIARRMATRSPSSPVTDGVSAPESVPDFVDMDPAKPLKFALYSRAYALSLVEDTGWVVESLNDPLEHIQHFMVCRPGGP